jgi:hypothetical protein
MSIETIIWLAYTFIHIFFIPWKIKKELALYFLGAEIIIAILFLVSLTKGIIHLNLQSVNFSYLKYLIQLFITSSSGVILSSKAWGERKTDKDDTKYRLILGKCRKCKMDIPRTAIRCPYCTSDLSH